LVVQLLAADMLAWESATIRARDVFRTGELVEVFQLGDIFTGTAHIRMGYTTKDTLKEWEQKLLDGENSNGRVANISGR
jgi:hypothetical protein